MREAFMLTSFRTEGREGDFLQDYDRKQPDREP